MDKVVATGKSITTFKKHSFADKVLTLMLVYSLMQYFVATYSIDIIAGNFNHDLLQDSRNKLLDIFTDDFQMVSKPTKISGFLVYHVYIMKSLMEEYCHC